MSIVVALLAFVVACEYVVIALSIVPRLARVANFDARLMAAARWGATAFFSGCAVTHLVVADQTLLPEHGHSPSALGMLEIVVPLAAEMIGGALFIGLVRSRLAVDISTKVDAAGRRQMDRQFRIAFDRVPLAIALPSVYDDLPAAGYANPAYFDLFGLDPSRSVLSASEILEVIHPDDRRAAAATMNHLMHGDSAELECRIVRPDGAVRWIHSRLSRVASDAAPASQVTVIVEDVTDRVEAAAALAQSERLFLQLAGSVAVGICLRQIEPHEFLYVNPAYVSTIGLDPTAVDRSTGSPEQTLLGRVHPDDADRVYTEYWLPALEGRVVQSVHRMLQDDGTVRWVHTTNTPIVEPDGSVTRIAGTVEDITDRVQAEEEMRSAQVEAERANAAKSEFLSRMSHELRTPLNAVLGFGQLLELDDLSPTQREALTHMMRGGRHLLSLVDDVLDIARIESDQLEISVEAVDVDLLVAEVAGLMQPAATESGVRIEVEARAPSAPTRAVRADRRRLQQSLLNLVSNAIKYNRAGGRVGLAIGDSDDGWLDLSVSDTGIGIRAEDVPRLFTPFDRLGRQSTSIEGIGIGLALTRSLVAAMDGELQVASTVGEGSVFTITLPRMALDSDADPFPAGSDDRPDDPSSSSLRLLYIDDNPSNIELMSRVVAHCENWTMSAAANGTEGMRLAHEVDPRLILLDLHLPDVSGLEVLRALKDDPATADIPVIVLSADANGDQVARLIAAGALRYRTKPIDVEQIMADLAEHSH